MFVRSALHDAIHNVFAAVIGSARLGVIALLLMPSRTVVEQS